MAKVFVFTLSFVSSINQNLHESYHSSPSPYPGLSALRSSLDDSGFSQYFCASGLHNLIRFNRDPQNATEPIEIHCFTRAFTKLAQVERAARDGCFDIYKFYNLVNELRSKEQISILCRIWIHGAKNAEDGFEMEDLQPSGVPGHGISKFNWPDSCEINANQNASRIYVTHSIEYFVDLLQCRKCESL